MPSYHDYVIKDGKYIGKFEEMYAQYDDPWLQSTQPNKYGREFAISCIQRFNIKSLIEFGCGLGYYGDWIYQSTGVAPLGVDISPTAIQKAKQFFPHLTFQVGDIHDIDQFPTDVDAIMFAEIGWFILDKIDDLFDKLLKRYAGKYFINNQCFYRGEDQKYGRDFFKTVQEYIAYCPFKLMGYLEATTMEDANIDSSCIFKIEKK